MSARKIRSEAISCIGARKPRKNNGKFKLYEKTKTSISYRYSFAQMHNRSITPFTFGPKNDNVKHPLFVRAHNQQNMCSVPGDRCPAPYFLCSNANSRPNLDRKKKPGLRSPVTTLVFQGSVGRGHGRRTSDDWW